MSLEWIIWENGKFIKKSDNSEVRPTPIGEPIATLGIRPDSSLGKQISPSDEISSIALHQNANGANAFSGVFLDKGAETYVVAIQYYRI